MKSLTKRSIDLRYEKMRTAVESLLTKSGTTEQDLRERVHDYTFSLAMGTDAESIPDDLRAYIDKVALHAYQVTDGDIEALKASGYSEDDIYELTLAASTGASLARFDAGMAALGPDVAADGEASIDGNAAAGHVPEPDPERS